MERRYLVLLVSLIFGCMLDPGGEPEPDFPPATEIVGFTFSPSNSVSVGDVLTVTCNVKDSNDSDLRFGWGIGIHASQYSESNSITFKVKETDKDVETGSITIQKLNSGRKIVEQDFTFNIID